MALATPSPVLTKLGTGRGVVGQIAAGGRALVAGFGPVHLALELLSGATTALKRPARTLDEDWRYQCENGGDPDRRDAASGWARVRRAHLPRRALPGERGPTDRRRGCFTAGRGRRRAALRLHSEWVRASLGQVQRDQERQQRARRVAGVPRTRAESGFEGEDRPRMCDNEGHAHEAGSQV